MPIILFLTNFAEYSECILALHFTKKYRIIIEDESSLKKRLNVSARLYLFLILLFFIILLAGGLGILFFATTPLKKQLPGYLQDSERIATEEQHLRLDSLVRVYEVNEAYISGILNALNPSLSEVEDSTKNKPSPLILDSLMIVSEEEKEFLETIRERDKYNLTYNSPAAAQSLMFASVNKSGIISEESKNRYQAEILIPIGDPVSAVAEGKVISISTSPRFSGSYDVLIQHPKGFLSKTSRLTNLLVKPGDRVSPGQIIALSTAKNGTKSNKIFFELWHDGNPLIPAEYIDGGISTNN